MVRASYLFALPLAAVLCHWVACASVPPQEAAEPPAPTVTLVSATVLANDCGIVHKWHAKQAADAMRKLVEGCKSVPGGSMRFAATLSPGGRIEFVATADGGVAQPDVVPMCVLKHELRHRVPLKQPCTLEVRLKEETLPLPGASSD